VHALIVDTKLEDDRFTQRMLALAASGKLEARGDVRAWRTSEVRVPAPPATRDPG
jgi:hypothetical protein